MSVTTVSSRNIVEYLKQLKRKEDAKISSKPQVEIKSKGSRLVIAILAELLSQLKKGVSNEQREKILHRRSTAPSTEHCNQPAK